MCIPRTKTVTTHVPAFCELKLTAQYWPGLTDGITLDHVKPITTLGDFCNGGCQHLRDTVKNAIPETEFQNLYPRSQCMHVFHMPCLIMQYSASLGVAWEYYPHPSSPTTHGLFLLSPKFGEIQKIPSTYCPVCVCLLETRTDPKFAFNTLARSCLPSSWIKYLNAMPFAALSYPYFRQEDLVLLMAKEEKTVRAGQIIPMSGYRHQDAYIICPETMTPERMKLDDSSCGTLAFSFWNKLYPAGTSQETAEQDFNVTRNPTRCRVTFEPETRKRKEEEASEDDVREFQKKCKSP